MRSSRKKQSITFKLSKYLPVFIILLSLTIILGSTFAYFMDKVERESDLVFSKVELSSETTTGYNGELHDVIPGTPIVDGALKFSKSIDSEPIYVRAKLSFSLPEEFKTDPSARVMLDALRSATEFNIVEDSQHNAVWSNKIGNYYYLLDKDNNNQMKYVDTIDTYVLSNEIVVPRDLKQAVGNDQYMKTINFHIAFEAVQADNVNGEFDSARTLFNQIFPQAEAEKSLTMVILKSFDHNENLDVLEIETGDKISQPTVKLPVDENGEPTMDVEGWYTDKGFENKYDFSSEINEDLILYPNTYSVSKGLKYTEIKGNVPAATTSQVIGYSVAKGTCTDTVIGIPSTYKGKPVTTIASSGFSNMSSLTAINLPNCVTSIGDWAFSYCNGITKLELSKDLTKINSYAFYNCSNLDIETMPSEVNYIGAYGFGYCSKLTLPNFDCKMTSITSSMFSGCTSLACKTLPSGLTSIGNSAFSGFKNLAIESMPDSVTSIGYEAFENCKNITLSELPSGLTSIGYEAFYGCSKITISELPSGITKIENSTFYGCSGIKSLTLGSNITSIGSNAFSSCTNLKYLLCESEAVANLVKSKGVDNKYIYVEQTSGYGEATETEVVISDTLTIYTATVDGYKWVRTADNKYYKAIA